MFHSQIQESTRLLLWRELWAHTCRIHGYCSVNTHDILRMPESEHSFSWRRLTLDSNWWKTVAMLMAGLNSKEKRKKNSEFSTFLWSCKLIALQSSVSKAAYFSSPTEEKGSWKQSDIYTKYGIASITTHNITILTSTGLPSLRGFQEPSAGEVQASGRAEHWRLHQQMW